MDRYRQNKFSLDPTFASLIRSLKMDFTELWWSCDTDLPELGPSFSRREQVANERRLDQTIKSLLAEVKQPPQSYKEQIARQNRFAESVSDQAKRAFGLQASQIQAVQDYGFAELVLEFAGKARRFDPSLSDEEIFQAGRNAWSMHLMQLLFGKPLRITPSVFAYSLLYPYTDNYFDDPTVTPQEKKISVVRFGRRLVGERLHPSTTREQKVFDLIHMVEREFDRASAPQVFESLLAIYLAQTKSINLLQNVTSPYEIDVLGICFEKGGTSTLADGYLIAGELTPAQARLAYFYGTLTQLFDDLEDVQQDTKDGILTIFTQTAQHWSLDAVTNRTFHFAHHFLKELRAYDAPETTRLIEVMDQCLPWLIVFSAGRGRHFYSRTYRKKLQGHFPFRFAFLDRQINKLTRLGVSSLSLTEAFAFEPPPRMASPQLLA